MSTGSYIPMFLSWCTSYEEEVGDLAAMIEAHPEDVKQLRRDYQALTGKRYYSKR